MSRARILRDDRTEVADNSFEVTPLTYKERSKETMEMLQAKAHLMQCIS
jgi:hypothetical protein